MLLSPASFFVCVCVSPSHGPPPLSLQLHAGFPPEVLSVEDVLISVNAGLVRVSVILYALHPVTLFDPSSLVTMFLTAKVMCMLSSSHYYFL